MVGNFTPNTMRMSITSVFGVPLEKLHEKYGFPTPGFFLEFPNLEFLELDVFGREFMELS